MAVCADPQGAMFNLFEMPEADDWAGGAHDCKPRQGRGRCGAVGVCGGPFACCPR